MDTRGSTLACVSDERSMSRYCFLWPFAWIMTWLNLVDNYMVKTWIGFVLSEKLLQLANQLYILIININV